MTNIQELINKTPKITRCILSLMFIMIVQIIINLILNIVFSNVKEIISIFLNNIMLIVTFVLYRFSYKLFFKDLNLKEIKNSVIFGIITIIIVFILMLINPILFSTVFYFYGSIGFIILYINTLLPNYAILVIVVDIMLLFIPLYFYFSKKVVKYNS